MKQLIHLSIPYDTDLMARARTVPRAHWDPRLKFWTVPDGRTAWIALERADLLGRIVAVVPVEDHPTAVAKTAVAKTAVAKTDMPAPMAAGVNRSANPPGAATGEQEQTSFREALMREGAAYATVKAYVGIVRQLQQWWRRPLSEARREDLLAYQTFCIDEKRYGRATMNQVVNGIRAYYERVLQWPKDELRLPRPRKQRTLPNVCSEEEVLRMLRMVDNLKHRMILTMIYGLGLRKGEI